MKSKKFLVLALGAMMLCPMAQAHVKWGKLALGGAEVAFGGVVGLGSLLLIRVMVKEHESNKLEGTSLCKAVKNFSYFPGIGGLLIVDGLHRCHAAFKNDEKVVADGKPALKDLTIKKQEEVTP